MLTRAALKNPYAAFADCMIVLALSLERHLFASPVVLAWDWVPPDEELHTIQWKFWDTNFVGAAGVLLTIAGQKAVEAIYPNLSIFYYLSQTGKVLMR